MLRKRRVPVGALKAGSYRRRRQHARHGLSQHGQHKADGWRFNEHHNGSIAGLEPPHALPRPGCSGWFHCFADGNGTPGLAVAAFHGGVVGMKV